MLVFLPPPNKHPWDGRNPRSVPPPPLFSPTTYSSAPITISGGPGDGAEDQIRHRVSQKMHLPCFNGELCKLVHFQIRIVLVSSDQREIRQMPTSIFGASLEELLFLRIVIGRMGGGGGRTGSTQNCFPFLVKIGAARREERKGESDQAITPFLELRSPPPRGVG